MSNARTLTQAADGDDGAAPHPHAVQFYDDEEVLFDTVAKFLSAGIERGEPVVIIATAPHAEGIARHLRNRGVDASEPGRVTVLDARETLAEFMVDDMPDRRLFREVLARVLGQAKGRAPATHVRAFGEMVDVVWRDGNSRAAIRLEELWNEAANDHSFSLLCAYVMGNFYREGDAAQFLEVCRAHSHVLPTDGVTHLEEPRTRLREISVLRQRARTLEAEVAHRMKLEAALRDALAHRGRVEEELRESVRREHEARARAEESDAFKEQFLAILGHDLRNPLNTILVTAQLMTMRGDLLPDNQKRMERVVASGARMQRMIDQLLDVTQARLAGGIPVSPSKDERDLVALVAEVVDDMRAAHPTRVIEIVAPTPTMVRLDADRFERVVANLVCNAVTHGAVDAPVRVELTATEAAVTLRVHNDGRPIDPALLPRLFDPFKTAAQPRKRPAGLGLGLYISESIVRAHGGTIHVESSVERGTTFEVSLPRHHP
jgi:signal transduction histidine kinase